MIVAKRTNDWLDLLQLPDFQWWQFLFATACLVVLIWSVMRFVSSIHDDVDPAESEQDMLNAISELRREGDLTEDEYRSIKSQLMERMTTSSQIEPKEIPSTPGAGQPADKTLQDFPGKAVSAEEKSNDLLSVKAESIQSITSSILTEVVEPLADTARKSTGSMTAGTENSERIQRQLNPEN